MSHSLRPLLPATNNSGSRDTADSPPAGSRPAKRAPTKAACEACRRRKSKCSAERPRCTICVERNTICEYSTLPAETHLTAQKRRFNDLQSKCESYESLVDLFRTRQEDEALGVFQRIRAGVDVEAIVRNIQDGDLLLQLSLRPECRSRYEFPYKRRLPAYLIDNSNSSLRNPYLESTLYVKTSVLPSHAEVPMEVGPQIEGDDGHWVYTTPYHAAELLEPRLSSIDVTRWTAVPASNSVLRTLLEIYFIFEYPSNTYFHKDLFLDDMADGNQRFCSPLLVNAILAAAWHGYYANKTRADFWRPESLGYRFSAEAHRLLHRERDMAKITTAQAMTVMKLTHNSNGTDDLGWPLLHGAIEMAQELDLFSLSRESDAAWQRAAAITSWGIFNLQTRHPAHHLPDPDAAPAFYGEILVKYPAPATAISISHGHVFRAISEYRVILNTVCLEIHSNEAKRIPLEAAFRVRLSLRDWYEGLPGCLEPDNIALPSHLMIHPTPTQVIAQAKGCLETIVRLYYLRHGFESYDPALILYADLLAWSSLRDYLQMKANGSAHADAMFSTLVLCAKALWDQGKNCIMSEAIFWFLRSSLPGKEEVRLFREVAEVDEEINGISRFISEIRSSWPVGIFSNVKSNVEAVRLGRFVSWYEKTIEEQSQQLSTQGSDQADSPDADWLPYP
ncbi:hypothetical protein JX265_002956 [Neoarthrinium moseri]|uniref:Zn(2)-C6 fungal-type domain-containing protein n=1 Tax=Neoarthrinium moseri TaxID=1658444 RepID=A0A9P9WTD6_9PEZI|nr:uncharacterized protein JN550_006113 [Neoarthrinium moseri]KAI1844183.1 hypothetical protein JX266_009667 [Neoarthrinium moseri]KAI1869126.1 hypothetical protein JN550_006113 [Neoarthrinium moseri]KAI1878779.1 hypothetical protein JX265_002956 [Neoarthrinium moseri]